MNDFGINEIYQIVKNYFENTGVLSADHLDSLRLIEFITFAEAFFNVTFDYMDMSKENMSCFSSMANLIYRKLSEGEK